jgi:hypothetical protein
LRDDLGLVRIPKRMWPLFKKCAKNLHFPDVTGRESGDEVIFMSGVPLHMAEEILESIESGEVQPTLLRIAFQDMWVGANKKATWTVWCPKYGRMKRQRHTRIHDYPG